MTRHTQRTDPASRLLSNCPAITLALACLIGCNSSQSPAPGDNAEQPAAAGEQAAAAAEKSLTTAEEVLEAMAAAYRGASSYADSGTVSLRIEPDPRQYSGSADFSVAMVRPNKLRMHVYQAMVVSDGKQFRAALGSLPDQVLGKEAPAELTFNEVYSDPLLTEAMSRGFAGAAPQLLLLLAEDALKVLLREAEETVLAEPATLDDRHYYRVRVKQPNGSVVLWIDQQSHVLRRIVLPTDQFRQMLEQELKTPVQSISMVADFLGARLDGEVDPKAFEFEAPEGASMVKFFLMPHPAQQLGLPVPDFKFFDLAGNPIGRQSLAGKIAVLDFWATSCQPCRTTLPKLQKVYQRYKDDRRVVFYGVSVDPPQVADEALEKMFADLGVAVPVLRDPQSTAAGAFTIPGLPTTFILGADGRLQGFQVGAEPNLETLLPEKLDKLLAGEDIYQGPLDEYKRQVKDYEKRLDEAAEDRSSRPYGERIPRAKIAQRTEPQRLKLVPLWRCSELKEPGNVLPVTGPDGAVRLLVVEALKSVAEVGLDGKLIAIHPLEIEQMEVVSALRSAAGADGKRYVVAFASAQQRLHLLDENWKKLFSFPKDALENNHSGIADVQLGDLDGDGSPEIYVGYWGVVGVQAVSLQAERIWSNRSVSEVIRLAVGGPDAKGQRNLFCINRTGALVVFDAEGQRRGEVLVPNRLLHWIVAAELRSGGADFCGLAASVRGENVAVGLNRAGEEIFSYRLPAGVHHKLVEQIIPGRVTPAGPGQWLLPGPDGSIHVITADGKLLDRFNYGEALGGLATVTVDGRPVLIVASAQGLQAWRIE